MKTGLNRYVLTQEIYERLKEQILDHTLPPGEKINIDQVARDLEVSNIPVREALSRLAAEGLVRMVPFKGMFVAEISVKELDEIIEVRTQLEVLAVQKAVPNIPAAEIDKAIREVDILRKKASGGKGSGLNVLVRMNEIVHGIILRHADNQILQNLIRLYRERIERYLAVSYRDITMQIFEQECEEHDAILSSIRQGDVDGAVSALRNHLLSSYQRTRELFMMTDNGKQGRI